MKPYQVIFLSAIIFAAGCGPMDKGNSEAVKKEMDSREVKRVLPSQIIDKAREKGQAITSEAQKTLLQTLMKKMETEGVVGAVEYCNVNALPLVDSVARAHKASLRRVSNRWRNPKDAPGEDEVPIMEAYSYSAEQGLELREEVFFDENNPQVIYTRPIMLGAGLCLQCHGQKDKDIAPEVQQKISELYSADNATGYNLGEWRGIWKVVFEKKELVLEL